MSSFQGTFNRSNVETGSVASVYNYRSLPRFRGEAMIQPLEGLFHENLWTVAPLCIRRGHGNSVSSTQPALADSYTIFDLGSDNGHGIYGIDTAGDVVVWGGTGCGVSASTCYTTYTNGVATS